MDSNIQLQIVKSNPNSGEGDCTSAVQRAKSFSRSLSRHQDDAVGMRSREDCKALDQRMTLGNLQARVPRNNQNASVSALAKIFNKSSEIFLPEQIKWHNMLYESLTKPSRAKFTRAHLHAIVGSGKTRIALSLLLRFILENKVARSAFIFLNPTLSFVMQELALLMGELSADNRKRLGIAILSSAAVGGSALQYPHYTLNYEKFPNAWKDKSYNLFFLSSGLIAHHSQSLLDGKLLSSVAFKVFLAVDEAHCWMSKHTKNYRLLEGWRPSFQLYITATSLPQGIKSIPNLLNTLSLADEGLHMGETTLHRGWEDNLSIDDLNIKSVFVQESYYDYLYHIRDQFDVSRKDFPASTTTYTCTKNIKLNVLLITPSVDMSTISTWLETVDRNPELRHQKQMSSFVSQIAYKEAFLFPQKPTGERLTAIAKLETLYGSPNCLRTCFSGHYCHKTGGVLKPLLKILTKERKVIIVSRYSDRLHWLRHNLYELTYIEKAGGTKRQKTSSTIQGIFEGETSDTVKEGIIKDFQDNNSSSVVLLMASKLAIGLNLQAASAVVFLEPDWTYLGVEQAIGRVARFGQCKDVLVYTLVYKGTIEETIMDQCLKWQFLFRFLRHIDSSPRNVRVPIKGSCKINTATDYIRRVYSESSENGIPTDEQNATSYRTFVFNEK